MTTPSAARKIRTVLLGLVCLALFGTMFDLIAVGAYNGSMWEDLVEGRAQSWQEAVSATRERDDASRLAFVAARLPSCLRSSGRPSWSAWRPSSEEDAAAALDQAQAKCLRELRGELLTIDPSDHRTIELIDQVARGI